MKLISDWKRVMVISFSFWMQVAGLLVLIVPEVRYMITGQDYDPFISWWLGVIFLLAGLIGRIFQQGSSKFREWLRIIAVLIISFLLAFLLAAKVHAAPVSEQATLEIAVPFIAKEEQERRTAYLDIVGVPTICFGSTRGVHLGMKMTHQQCVDLLVSEVIEYRKGLHKYFTAETINYRLTPKRDTAYTSIAFNAGIYGIGHSTATRRLNNGNIAGGCQALTWWNKAGGRVIRGLVHRRKREYDLCMVGL